MDKALVHKHEGPEFGPQHPHEKQSEHSAVGLERENPYGSLAGQPSQMVKFQVPVRDPVSSNKVDSS